MGQLGGTASVDAEKQIIELGVLDEGREANARRNRAEDGRQKLRRRGGRLEEAVVLQGDQDRLFGVLPQGGESGDGLDAHHAERLSLAAAKAAERGHWPRRRILDLS